MWYPPVTARNIQSQICISAYKIQGICLKTLQQASSLESYNLLTFYWMSFLTRVRLLSSCPSVLQYPQETLQIPITNLSWTRYHWITTSLMQQHTDLYALVVWPSHAYTTRWKKVLQKLDWSCNACALKANLAGYWPLHYECHSWKEEWHGIPY